MKLTVNTNHLAAWEFYRLRDLFHEPCAHPGAGAHFVNPLVLVSQARRERVVRVLRRRHMTSLDQRQDGRYPQQFNANALTRPRRHRAEEFFNLGELPRQGAG